MATTKLTARAGHGTWRQTQGIGVLLINGCLSGASGVTNEYLIKLSDPRAPLMFKVPARHPPAPRRSPRRISVRSLSRDARPLAQNMHIYFFCLLAAAPTFRPSQGERAPPVSLTFRTF